MLRHILFMLPIVIFSALVGFFAYRLLLIERGNTPDVIPSALMGQPAPEFALEPLLGDRPGLKTADLKGKVTILNFFASWCMPCHAEHERLLDLTNKGYEITGIDYKDSANNIKKWFAEKGDPYKAIGVDANGATAIDFGVYGLPETFLIDREGIIRFKHAGPLTNRVINSELIPAIKELEK